MLPPWTEDEDDEYVPGDPERPSRDIRLRIGEHEAPGHPSWRALSVPERIVVVRWLQRGDARGLLRARAGNPVSPLLRYAISEGLAGGPETGWRLRIASSATGGAPKKADKTMLASLQSGLAGHGDIGALARTLATIVKGERSRRGPISDPMQAAMVGLAYYLAYDRLSSENDARAKKARNDVHRFYGRHLGEDNIQRLITVFNKAGK